MQISNLENFIKFCEEKGWRREPSVGEWEILRMRHTEQPNLLLMHKNKHGRISTQGVSTQLSIEFDMKEHGYKL